jgi:hypothetical protein
MKTPRFILILALLASNVACQAQGTFVNLTATGTARLATLHVGYTGSTTDLLLAQSGAPGNPITVNNQSLSGFNFMGCGGGVYFDGSLYPTVSNATLGSNGGGNSWNSLALQTGIAQGVEFDNGTAMYSSGTSSSSILKIYSPLGIIQLDGVTKFSGSGVSANGVPYLDSSSLFKTVSPSTAGYVLTSNGPTSAPSFQASGGGGGGGISGATSGQVVVATGATTGTSYAGFTSDSSGNVNVTSLHSGFRGAGSNLLITQSSGSPYPITLTNQGSGGFNFTGGAITVDNDINPSTSGGSGNLGEGGTASWHSIALQSGLFQGVEFDNGTYMFANGSGGSSVIELYNATGFIDLQGATKISANVTFTAAGTGILGNTSGGTANAGVVGERMIASLSSVSPVSLTSGAAANVTSVNLTAGSWLIWGYVYFTASSGTPGSTLFSGGFSTTSASLASVNTGQTNQTAAPLAVAGVDGCVAVLPVSVIISGSQTFYLVAGAIWGSGTMGTYGRLVATRQEN